MTSPKQGTIKGIIFDFDGTLLDSAPDLMATVNRILEPAGRRPVTLGEVQGMIGDGAIKLIERAFAATGGVPDQEEFKGLSKQFIDIYTGEDAETDHLYPGAIETLQTLKRQNFTLGLCTNKPIAPTQTIIKNLDIECYFSAVSGGNSIPGISKPDPRHLLNVIEELGLTPESCVMIGDKEQDIYCAKDAGVRSILVSFGYAKLPLEEIGADRIIDILTEVPAVIEDFT